MSELDPFRRRIDAIDDELLRLLSERFDICREVARFKSERGIPMMQHDRVVEVHERYKARGAKARLPADFTTVFVESLVSSSCDLEDELIKKYKAGKEGK